MKGLSHTCHDIVFATQHPIKANPAKAGDAKSWVYCRENGYDRQAAELHDEQCINLVWPGFLQVRLFLSG
jgi:hypothetical protein